MKYCPECGKPVFVVTNQTAGNALVMGCRPCNAIYFECVLGHTVNKEQPAWQKQKFTTLEELERNLHENRPYQNPN